MTMDSPKIWNAWVYRNAAIRSLRNATPGFCGIRVRGVTRLAEVRHRSDTDRERWIGGMASLGATDAESVAPRESEELVPAWRAPDEPPGASAFSHGYDDLAACSPFSVPGQRSRHLAQAEDPIDVDAEVTARA